MTPEPVGRSSATLDEPVLDVDEIQGDVLPGFNTLHRRLIAVCFDQRDRGQTMLAELAPRVATLAEVCHLRSERRERLAHGRGRPRTPLWLNLALTARGLQRLGADPTSVRDRSFAAGLGAISPTLGDPTDPGVHGHPSTWRVGGTAAREPDALLLLGNDDAATLAIGAERILAALRAAGVCVLYDETGAMLPGGREHFGFRDGIAGPAVRGRLSARPDDMLARRSLGPTDPRAPYESRPGRPLVWPGQFVFGLPRQLDDPVVAGPAFEGGAAWVRNGSLLVFRRLEQDVSAFRRFLATEAPGLPRGGEERLAALLVGRWPSGAPLVRWPEADPGEESDDFGYALDLLAVRCPAAAHIRKVNPRDLPTDLGGSGRTLATHVLRRSIPYGGPDAAERGLLFLCWQTSIVRQFERLTVGWMNRDDAPQPGGHDLLVGQAPVRCAMLDGVAVVTSERFVVPTGGAYLFAPSTSALRALAEGDTS